LHFLGDLLGFSVSGVTPITHEKPMETTKPSEPRQGQRRTTLSLTPKLWDRLKEIERETGARPSVIVRRALEQCLRDYEDASHPAA
jgi:hypothetical protein